MIDLFLKLDLHNLDVEINRQIDGLIIKRDQACDKDKQIYRYVVRRLEQMLGCVHKAQDKLPVEFKLDD